jgi:hypothetical protein
MGCMLRARLRGSSAPDCRLDDSNTLPRPLGGRPSGLYNGWGWTLAPAGEERHVNVRGSAAPDK